MTTATVLNAPNNHRSTEQESTFRGNDNDGFRYQGVFMPSPSNVLVHCLSHPEMEYYVSDDDNDDNSDEVGDKTMCATIRTMGLLAIKVKFFLLFRFAFPQSIFKNI